MAQTIAIRILTQAGVALEDEAVSIIAPGGLGSIGFLRNHAPLVTTLAPGRLSWRRADGTGQVRRVGRGLLEVAGNQVTLLTETLSEPSPSDVSSPQAGR